MSLKGFEKGFPNSKVASTKILNDSHSGKLGLGKFGNNVVRQNVPFKSNTKAAINPTSDSDDGNPRASGLSAGYGISSKGGASGDGPTPGYSGSGAGVASLNGVYGRI